MTTATTAALTCTVDPASVQRLKTCLDTGWVETLTDDLTRAAQALEATFRVIEHGGELAAGHREILETMISRDNVLGGSGFMADDLTELLFLAERRQQGIAVVPPACTEAQLLAVKCPVCVTVVGENCRGRYGDPQYHAERFWAASGGYVRPPALVPRVPEDAVWIPDPYAMEPGTRRDE